MKKKLCARCHKVTLPKGVSIYCGSANGKKGCSYIIKLERSRKWRKQRPLYWKIEEAWRQKSGFYKRKDVIEKRRKRQREYYQRNKLNKLPTT